MSSFGYSGTIAHVTLYQDRSIETLLSSWLVYRRRAFPWQHKNAYLHASSQSQATQPSNAGLSRARILSITADTPLMEAGVRSMEAVRLAASISSLSNVPLQPTLIFDHPTPRSIVEHLATASEGSTCILGDVEAMIKHINEALFDDALESVVTEAATSFPPDPGEVSFLCMHLTPPSPILKDLVCVPVHCRRHCH